MTGFGDLVKKEFYLGVGLASYAGEKAGGKISELRVQAQKLADEMVAKGEMSTEEARRFVEEMVSRAQQPGASTAPPTDTPASEPRRIEILTDDEEPISATGTTPDVDNLRKQVMDLQEELRRLERDS